MRGPSRANSAIDRWIRPVGIPGGQRTGRVPDLGLVDACVHCGFCLASCPTYLLWGEEMDSPRGRIYLIRELAEGEPRGAVMQTHFDRCLGCMACMTACPSGVRYDELLEVTRAEIERCTKRSWQDRTLRRFVFELFPFRGRLRAVTVPLRFYQRSGLAGLVHRRYLLDHLPVAVRTLESIAPRVPRFERFPEIARARGERRGVVAMLTGCVQSVLFSPVNAATVRVLVAEGFDVVIPPKQGCCGALSAHAGRDEEARRFARRLIDAFESRGVNTIIVNSAGCGSAMKQYAHLLRAEPRLRATSRAVLVSCPRRGRAPRRLGASCRTPPARSHRRLPRRLSPLSRSRRERPAPRSPAGDSRTRPSRDR